MFNGFRWGGISVRGLIRTLLPDVWMVIAAMIITYLAIGIVGPLAYTPEYEVNTIAAVYPDNKLSAADSSSDRIDAAAAANGVLGSSAFREGLEELLGESEDRTFENFCVKNTNLVSITVRSSSAEDAYNSIRTLIDYYNEMAGRLTGNGVMEIVEQPKIPEEPSNSPLLLNYRLLLTLFMGFATGAFLVFLYMIRKTYKTAGAVQRQYKDARFFLIPEAPTGKIGFTGKRRKKKALRQNALGITAEELRQMLHALGGKSILISSCAKEEGTAEFACELAEELESSGRSVLLLEADFDTAGLTKKLEKEGNLPEQGIQDVLLGRCSVKDVCVRHNEKNILTAYAGLWNAHEDSQFSYTPEDAERVMEEAGSLADIVLVDSGVWGGAGDGKIWNSFSDFSLALCAPDRAEFFAEDQLIADLSNGPSDFAGMVLNGF